MNRYRNWVGALHWGQLLLLVPTLLFTGMASGVGGRILENDMRDTARRELSQLISDSVQSAQTQSAFDAVGFTRDAMMRGFATEEIARILKEEGHEQLAQKYLDVEARTASRAAWVLWAGMLGWAFAWLTAFLSLWWWFGARAKPSGAA